ncbi:MAG: hypothetical protein JNG88_11570 [Phycisphaerales bacterium]|nr:hypothetical protein [Phycisphaerales bacterium]
MIIATIGESAVDDAIYRVFIDALLGTPSQPPPLKSFRRRSGDPFAGKFLGSILAECHYHTGAIGVVIIVDGNGSPIHQELSTSEHCASKCRVCEGRSKTREVVSSFRSRLAAPLRVALGVAYPPIENWLLFGRSKGYSESEWSRKLHTNPGSSPNHVKELKEALDMRFKVEADRIRDGVNHAQKVIEDLDAFEAAFPMGFGLMAAEIRKWKT